MFFRQERAERQSGGDRLGDGDDVGHHAETLEGEDLAGAPEAALDLVEDERGLMLVGKGPACKQEFFRTLEDSAFAEDGLQHDGAGVGIDGSAQRFDVVLRNKGHVFEQRLKTFAVLVLAGQGHGAKRPAVIRTLQRHQLALGFAARLVSGETRQLDGAFHGLGAAVREEDAIKARKLAKTLGELSLIFVVIEIRNVNEAGRLLADGLHDARMSMTRARSRPARPRSRDTSCLRSRRGKHPSRAQSQRDSGCRWGEESAFRDRRSDRGETWLQL